MNPETYQVIDAALRALAALLALVGVVWFIWDPNP